MNIINYLAMTVILLAAAFFIALGYTALCRPKVAARFLLGFAESARAHYVELSLRLVIGLALLQHSTTMLYPTIFELFAWVLIVSTACLGLIPWQWHRSFARKVVPYANRYLFPIGLISVLLGLAILLSFKFWFTFQFLDSTVKLRNTYLIIHS